MSSNRQMLIALLLAGGLVLIGIIESHRPEAESELVTWAQDQPGPDLGPAARLFALAGRMGGGLSLAGRSDDEGPGPGSGLPERRRAGATPSTGLAAILSEHDHDWDFTEKLDSLLAAPGLPDELMEILKRAGRR